ncbi:MAG: tRNA threonylcarbamoyladenosine biosynthesis protein TsaE [Alphaproteobacteria bacterium]|nr:tRNA threonylcarbamoyladenosine biosynthesis protein TsaE [Alphaproteobacteria bacterium]
MTSFTFTLTQQDLGRLWGDLGVGKTTFTRALVQALVGETIDVPSPTFTLVQVYDCPQGELWHCDLYRLKNSEEAFEIGLEDAFYHAICLIEWPERLEGLLPRCRIDITFKIINETTREITVNLVGSSHDALRTALESSR